MSFEIGHKLDVILAVYAGLLLFGTVFNAFIAWTEKRGYLEGYTSLAVALGVGVTIAFTGIFNLQFAALTLGAFFCSGLPMIVGSIARHAMEREQERKAIREIEK